VFVLFCVVAGFFLSLAPLMYVMSFEPHLQWKRETTGFGRSVPATLAAHSCLLHPSVRSCHLYTGELATTSSCLDLNCPGL